VQIHSVGQQAGAPALVVEAWNRASGTLLATQNVTYHQVLNPQP
jgi:hypothetical protein